MTTRLALACSLALLGCAGEEPSATPDASTADRCARVVARCESAGARCDEDVLVRCAADAFGCLQETRIACDARLRGRCDADLTVCVTDGDPCADLVDRCEAASVGCVGDERVECAADAFGCFVTTRTDCAASGATCEPTSGQCVVAPPDAGVDAGGTDAGVRRDGGAGGAMDAGSDAGSPLGSRAPLVPVATTCTTELRAALEHGELAGAMGYITGAGESRAYLAPTAAGTVLIAWSGPEGVHVREITRDRATVGAEAVVRHPEGAPSGYTPWGMDLDASHVALLVTGSTSAELALLPHAGGAPRMITLVGPRPTMTMSGDRYFAYFPGEGKIRRTPTGWAAYYTVNGLFGREEHQGDQLTMLDADGRRVSGGWDWGCSHSQDLDLVQMGDRLVTMCLSDGHPGNGFFTNRRNAIHRLSSVYDAFSDTTDKWGGVAVMPDGTAWVAFSSKNRVAGEARDQVAIARLRSDGTTDPVIWVTSGSRTSSHAHLARFGEHIVVGWTETGADSRGRFRIFHNWLQLRDGRSGEALGEPIDLPDATFYQASEMISDAHGDVVWARAEAWARTDGTRSSAPAPLRVMRLRCR
jgi:hypothetical protein